MLIGIEYYHFTKKKDVLRQSDIANGNFAWRIDFTVEREGLGMFPAVTDITRAEITLCALWPTNNVLDQ
jgi:hypothetical protein